MRDLIWTIIAIWVVWKLIDAFRSYSAKSTQGSTANNNRTSYNYNTTNQQQNHSPKKGELKPDAGEYVDYEEVK
ncbi:MAG TPA: DUF4834 family protein [Bacteroidia bacterium]|nr:DUF4834 family protein [Bacteroidia bacterium]MBN8692756.1 DUF4834 family protein [Bacteroidota bacterium]HRD40812.1 DUF4834 family protein [Bacteroidia bacterium]